MNIEIGKTYYLNYDNTPVKVILTDFMRMRDGNLIPMVLGIAYSNSNEGVQYTTSYSHEEFKRLFSEVPVCTAKVGTLVAGYMHKGAINPTIGVLLEVITGAGKMPYQVGTLSGPLYFEYIETLDDLTARLLAQYKQE